jgi:hypothetical protein
MTAAGRHALIDPTNLGIRVHNGQGVNIMPSVLDRVLEKELKDSLVRFEQQLRQAGLAEENVKSRVRGAKQFVAFLYGRYLRRLQRT